jgi:hypothetical protein
MNRHHNVGGSQASSGMGGTVGAGAGTGAPGPFDGMLGLMQMQLLSQSSNPVYTLFIVLAMSTFLPIVRSFLNMIIDYVQNALRRRSEALESALRMRTDSVKTVVDPVTQEIKIVNSITFVRQYMTGGSAGVGGAKGGDFTTADAILDLVLRQPNAQKVTVVADLEMITNSREINIATNEPLDIVFQLLKEQRDEHGDLRSITFNISSTLVTTEKIRSWSRSVTDAFVEARKNEIGDRQYFFDQITDDQRMQGQTVFTMSPFVTNRTLENVFYDQDSVVTKRVRFFKENRAWYV